jgi:hypothetical protein
VKEYKACVCITKPHGAARQLEMNLLPVTAAVPGSGISVYHFRLL